MGDRNKRSTKRDGGRFLALPHNVIESDAYRMLGHVARSLLIDIALQYSGNNNGKLTACKKYLHPRGWTSGDTVTRTKSELLASGLLIETRKGGFPNRAAWYMLAWQDLDVSAGMDGAPDTFQRMRRGYQQGYPALVNGAVRIPTNGARLIPSHGAAGRRTDPSHGTGA